jgi:hypothetical protein
LENSIKILSWIILGLTAIAIIFYSSWFYLGTEETFNNLKDDLLVNLTLRTLVFSMFGIPTTIIITIIEYFGVKKESNKYRKLIRKFVLVVSTIFISSLLGNIIFYCM